MIVDPSVDDFYTPVQRVTLFTVTAGRWPFLTVADHADLLRRNTQGDQSLPDGIGAALAQRDVVFGAATLVGMAFELGDDPLVLGQITRVRLDDGSALWQDFGAVEAEIDDMVGRNHIATGHRLTSPPARISAAATATTARISAATTATTATTTATTATTAAGIIGFVVAGRLVVTIAIGFLTRLRRPRLTRHILRSLSVGRVLASRGATGQNRERSSSDQGSNKSFHGHFPSTLQSHESKSAAIGSPGRVASVAAQGKILLDATIDGHRFQPLAIGIDDHLAIRCEAGRFRLAAGSQDTKLTRL